MVFKIPGSGQQIELICTQYELQLNIERIGAEVMQAEYKFPKWPKDLNYGDQIINEEKGEATKALLDICQGKATLAELKNEYIQTAAMCVRQIVAIERLEDYIDAQ